MTDRDLDSLVALARAAAPRADAQEDARVISAAMLAGAARHRRHVALRVGGAALALAAAVLVGTLVPSAQPPRELTRLELASGDVLTAARCSSTCGLSRRASTSRS